MKSNKKNMSRVFGIILGFSILFIFAFFMTILIKEIGKTEILDKIDNYTLLVEDSMGISDNMKEHIHKQPENFQSINLHYDLYFLLSLAGTFMFTLFISYKSRELGYMSFFGYIFLGMTIFLYVVSVITLISDWLVDNLIIGFLEFDLTTTPIISWWLSGLGFKLFVWASILLIVNRLNFTRSREDLSRIEQVGGGNFEK